jgi:3-hydroxyacyl-CoA dehydrogenase / enoyl-CoA hydratase / 3-hydroxybutyryl-CoA epimerase / enoyl-CoA isomerase
MGPAQANGMSGFKYEKGADDIVIVTMDMPGQPVNIMNAAYEAMMQATLARLESDIDSVAGIILTSGKSTFFAGGDLNALLAIEQDGLAGFFDQIERRKAQLRRLETLGKPVVAAINGTAMGAGLEIALACHHRIALDGPGIQLGLPEVTLGILPGCGGIVRLVRKIGLAQAMRLLTEGTVLSAAAARSAGIVDDLAADADELFAKAKAWIQANPAACQPFDVKGYRIPGGTAAEAANANLLLMAPAIAFKRTRGLTPAPAQILAVAAESTLVDVDTALRIESRGLTNLVATPEAKNLIRTFFSGQYLTKCATDRARLVVQPAARAAVIGAGIMGGGIAYQSALTGTPVIMKDIAQAGLDLGINEADKLLSRRVKNGQMSPDRKAAILGSIEPTLDYGERFKSIDVLVEAVIENLGVKRAVLAEAERNAGASTIICSNTSTLPISDLAQGLQRPQQFCGMHFFNPVHAMPLVEVIRGRQTSDDTINRAVAYALSLQKQPVVVNDCAGFFVNRLLFAYFAGFLKLVQDGADYEDVDRAMEQWGWPMGPAYLADVVGLDTMQHCYDVLSVAYPRCASTESKTWYQVIIELGGLGQKNGKGFYLHGVVDGQSSKRVNPEAKARIAGMAQPIRKFSDQEIVERIMVGMAIELAHALEEGIVASPEEADVALLYGVGFPSFRGGLARWMDSVGLDAFCRTADRYASELGPLYRVTDRQRDMAAHVRTFYS